MASNSSDSAESKQSGQNVQPSSTRRILPQVVAAFIKNLLMLDFGLSQAIITIIIPALSGFDKEKYPDEMVQTTESEASWLGSIAYLSKLLGCVFSGWVTEHLGRKKALFVVNIPYALAWWLLYSSTTLTQVFLGNIVLGFAVGLMKTPTMTYISESCETSVRGVLNAVDGVSITLGSLLVFLLGMFIQWREVSMICLVLPIITMAGICFIPETPMWLLSRNKDAAAKKSLQWLRGWVPEENVQNEFDAMKKHQEFSSACTPCRKTEQHCPHPAPTLGQRLKDLTRKQTLKPGVILLITYVLSQIAGLMHLLPFLVQILNAYETSIDKQLGTVIITLSAMLATITMIFVVKFVGKRRIYLFSLAGASLTHFSLSAYGFYWLPAGITSFESKNKQIDPELASIIPLLALSFLRFCTIGINMIPIMMFAELFPFKTRSLATGLTTAINYVFLFIANKTFVNIEHMFSLPGALAVYGVIGAIGLIVTYKILPETERRSMHDIEKHFANNQLGLTDRKIPRAPTTNVWTVDTLFTNDEKSKDTNDRKDGDPHMD